MVATIINAPESDGTSLMQRNSVGLQAELKKIGADGDKVHVITDKGRSVATIDFIFKQGAPVPWLAIGITQEEAGIGTKEVRYKLADGKSPADLVSNLEKAKGTKWGVYDKGGRRRTRRTRRKSRARKSRRSRK
jgi:hypothetical protein